MVICQLLVVIVVSRLLILLDLVDWLLLASWLFLLLDYNLWLILALLLSLDVVHGLNELDLLWTEM